MAIFKRKSKAAKAAEAQPVKEVKQTPEPAKSRHMDKLSDTSSLSQPRAGHSDLYLARSSVYGYHGGGTPAPITPMGRGPPQISRNSSAYSGHPSIASFDSPILGNPKMAAAARDRGYVSPHVIADFGSSSVATSSGVRYGVSGERGSDSTLPDDTRNYVEVSSDNKRGNLVTEDSTIPANSLVMDSPSEISQSKPKSSGVLKSSSSDNEYAEAMSDGISGKLLKSGPKQARFQHHSGDDTLSSHDVTLPTDAYTQNTAHRWPSDLQYDVNIQKSPNEQLQLLRAYRPEANDASPQVPLIEQTEYHTQHHDRSAASRPDTQMNTGSAALSTLLMHHNNEQATVSSPHASVTRRGSIPPLSILDGFKVNKKGKILNEEGEPIGELVHGDIMDCVRQKVNAMGEVLDEYGNVVGRVSTLERVLVLEQPRQAPHPGCQPLDHYSGQGSGTQDEVTIPMSATLTATPLDPPQHSYAPPLPQKNTHIALTSSTSPSQHVQGAQEDTQVVPQLTLPSISPLEFVNEFLPHDAADSDSLTSAVNQSHDSGPDDALYGAKKPPQSSPQIPGASQQDSTRPSKDVTSTVQHMRVSSNPEVSGLTEAITSHSPTRGQTRRSNVPPLLRNLSDSSLSDLSKTYARPSMTSVPENEDLPDEDRNASHYSYKGEIPAADGPPSGTRLPFPSAMGARAIPSSLPRINMNGQLPQFQHNGAQTSAFASSSSRRNTPAVSTQGSRPALSARSSYSQPAIRSPLSSQVNSPPESETSTSDDGKHAEHLTTMPSLVHRRMSATSTVTSTNTGPTKTRTYFTHAGRITVGPDEQHTSRPDAAPSAPKSGVAATTTEKTATKKKRFSLRLGRK